MHNRIELEIHSNDFGQIPLTVPVDQVALFAFEKLHIEVREKNIWLNSFPGMTMEQFFNEIDIDRIYRKCKGGYRHLEPRRPIYRVMDYCFGRQRLAVDWLNESGIYSMSQYLDDPQSLTFSNLYNVHMKSIGPVSITCGTSLWLDAFYWLIMLYPPKKILPIVQLFPDSHD